MSAAKFGSIMILVSLSPPHGAERQGATMPSPAVEIHAKLDFDSGVNPFEAVGNGQVALDDEAAIAIGTRSLRVRRARPDSYFGARTAISVKGAQQLRIAFCVRATAMQSVTVNAFDRIRNDNTTPASPARVFDREWHPVVLRAEDFHHNSEPPERKIGAAADFDSLMLHGSGDPAAAGFWIDKLVIYHGRDTRLPAAPNDLRAAAAPDDSIVLTWGESADDTFAVVYSVHRRTAVGPWEKIGESIATRYRDAVGSPGTYTYRITAADYENNVSMPSAEISATRQAAGKAAPPDPDLVVDRKNYAEHVRAIHARGAGTVHPDVFLFAGDSITAASAYTWKLGSWLGRGLTVRQGVGQVTTAYAAAHIREYLSSAKPEFAIVMYGTNDSKGRRDIAAAMRHLAAVIDACIEAGTVPILSTIPPRDYDKSSNSGEARFNQAIRELGRQKRVPVSYAFEEMIRHDLRQILYDGVHLQPDGGNDAAGAALRRTMDEVYFTLRDTSAAW